MEEAIHEALEKDLLIDITTSGRKTGMEHRKEVAFHYLDGKVYVTGRPGRRSWYANLLAKPEFIFHIKQSLQRDVPATAIPITDQAHRCWVFQKMKDVEGERMQHLDVKEWTLKSPLVEVELELSFG